MSQRDFNNNTNNITDIYNSQNATNLAVSLLPTKTDVATSIVNNNLNYTTTLLLNTLINNNIIANNLLYSTTALVNTALTNAISLNNTSNMAFTTSSVNTAISTCNTFSSAYTNTKLSTEVVRADAAIVSAITANNLLYTPSLSIGIGSQFNSVSIGTNTKLFNGFSCVYGANATSSSYSLAIGYNSGNLSNINNTSCCYIGANSNIIQNSSFTNSVALGSSSIITNSNQVMLGDSVSTAYCANFSTPNLTATTGTINNLNLNGTTTYNYSSLSGLSSFKNQGFSSTSSNLKNIYAYDTVYNCNSITLPCGVYFINYKFELNYNVSQINYFLNFGLGSTSLLLNLQQNKNYCSSAGNITSTYNCSNSYCFVSTNGSVVYQNVMLNAFDNTTISVANLSQFIISAKMTAIRLA